MLADQHGSGSDRSRGSSSRTPSTNKVSSVSSEANARGGEDSESLPSPDGTLSGAQVHALNGHGVGRGDVYSKDRGGDRERESLFTALSPVSPEEAPTGKVWGGGFDSYNGARHRRGSSAEREGKEQWWR
jgi:hypothetical protein